jgi:hypothetical protein
MSYRLVVALALVAFAAVAEARNPRLKLPSFEHLESRAVESVDITFGRVPLRLASWFIGKEDPEDAELKEMLSSIRSLSVCHYRFDSDFVYSAEDLDAVRSQLEDKGWSQVVQVRDRKKDEDVDVFISIEDEKVTGIAIVASEPREFTIVNIVGRIDFEQVERWRAHFDSRGHRDWLPDAHTAEPDEHTAGL